MSINAQLLAPAMPAEGFPEFVRMREWATPGYRHKLARWWGPAGETDPTKWLPWVMLNPSTADGATNDPTLRRIIRFSWMWGFNGLVVFNLFPWRTPSPRELAQTVVGWDARQDWWVRDKIWASHDRIVKEVAHCDAVMVAWGSPAGALGAEVDNWAESLFEQIGSKRETDLARWCLGRTSSGDPIHPMARGKHRVPDTARPMPWEGAVAARPAPPPSTAAAGAAGACQPQLPLPLEDDNA